MRFSLCVFESVLMWAKGKYRFKKEFVYRQSALAYAKKHNGTVLSRGTEKVD